jgi:hypothetical protein
MTTFIEEKQREAIDTIFDTVYHTGEQPNLTKDGVNSVIAQTIQDTLDKVREGVPKEIEVGILDGRVRLGHNTCRQAILDHLAELSK